MKILKIIFIIDALIIATGTIILIIFGEIFLLDNINKYHTRYSSDNLISIDCNEIYYNKNKYNFDYYIVWIDNNNLIYEKDNSLYFKDKNNEDKLILVSNKTIIRSSVVYSNNILYYKTFDGYKAYDLLTNSEECISYDLYFEKRDGNKYIVDSHNMGLLSLNVKNKETNETIIINEDVLKTCPTFNTYMKYKKMYVMNNYLISNDYIYISFYFKEITNDSYGVTFKYDLINNKIECYDCFNKKNQYTNYYSFIVDKDNLWFLDLLR